MGAPMHVHAWCKVGVKQQGHRLLAQLARINLPSLHTTTSSPQKHLH